MGRNGENYGSHGKEPWKDMRKEKKIETLPKLGGNLRKSCGNMFNIFVD